MQGLQLYFDGDKLTLREEGESAPGPVFVDFVGGALAHRRRFGGGRGQPLARAVGLKGGLNPSVVDATAGLGRDAFVLASLGCTVTLVERSEVVAQLLEDGLRRAREDAQIGAWVSERLRLVQADAVDYLMGLGDEEKPQVVYLDPMFPHREKSAQVKKEMRIFQSLVGEGGDEVAESALLDAAIAAARCRVVVKRPSWAPPLAGRRPSAEVKGKKHRYDLYVNAAMGA